MAVPVVQTVEGFFEPTPKYNSSVAMLLDSADGFDAQTGTVEWVYHIYAYYGMDVADAYELVSKYIDSERIASKCNPPTWDEARTMIDILEGSSWLLYTNDQGFVTAQGFSSVAEAKEAFRIDDEAYSAWENQDDEEDVDAKVEQHEHFLASEGADHLFEGRGE